MISVTRKSHFCAAHRYCDGALSPEQNRELYGKYTNLHGHNYALEVTVAGEVNENTGMVVNLSKLDEITRERVIDVLDHKNLQEDIEELRDVIPTTEILAILIWKQLNGRIPDAHLARVRLYEDDDLFVDYYGENEGE